MIFFVLSLIIFILWFSLGRYSDDVSAIDSFHSAESVSNAMEQQEEVSRKSKQRQCTCECWITFFLVLSRAWRSTITSSQLNIHFTEEPTESVQNRASSFHPVSIQWKYVNIFIRTALKRNDFFAN